LNHPLNQSIIASQTLAVEDEVAISMDICFEQVLLDASKTYPLGHE